MTLVPGTRLGPYEILTLLGAALAYNQLLRGR